MAARVAEIAASEEAPIHGDVLEAILSHVPLIHLVPASQVSKSWSRAVSSSLRHFNKPRPWLLLRTQSTRPPYATTSHAYDPRSHVWIEISQPSIKYISSLQSSHSNLLYMLSPAKFSFSTDPLNLTWHHVAPPLVWRADPIVALVGDKIVVAGGACDFEDDPLAVEIFDTKTREWSACDSLPSILRDSAASTWLSLAATDEKLFAMEKSSGLMHWFDPNTKSWSEAYDLRPDQRIFHSAIGFSSYGLITIGIIGGAEKVEAVKIWKVNSDTYDCEEIGEMPLELVEKLKSESFGIPSINVCSEGNYVYIYNTSEAGELVAAELPCNGGGCRWWSVKNIVRSGGNCMERVVITCSEVGVEELQRAMGSANCAFAVKL